MTLKKCSQCARVIPQSSDVCDHCGHDAGEISTPPAQADVDASAIAQPPAAGRPAVSRGELATLVVGAAGSALVILALLFVRGAASPAATAAGDEPTVPKPSASASASTPVPAPQWTAANSDHWVGKARQSVAFEVGAANKVQVWTRQVQPVLVVRCVAGRTEAFVFTDSAAKMEPQDEDHTVNLQFDDRPQVTERWPDAEAHDALFAPDGAALARQLAAARAFTFTFTPHNAEPVTARFDVSGLAELMASEGKACSRQ